MIAAVVFGVLVTLTTEMLSLFKVLHRGGLIVSWLLIGGGLAWWLFSRPHCRQEVCTKVRQCLMAAVVVCRSSCGYEFIILALAFLVLAVGGVALCAPPNTWDSMTYHLGRVIHWMQNASVANYPTHIPRQLTYAPWAEFAILQLQILTQGDRLANFVQWGAFVGCLLGASEIAKRLGAGAGGQLLASVVCGSIPMALIQASGTQNDLVVAFWLVCLVVFILDMRARHLWTTPWLVGASCGLALLSKFTAYIYGMALMSWYLAEVFRQSRWSVLSWRKILQTSLIAALINVGYYARIFDLLSRAHWRLEARGQSAGAVGLGSSATVPVLPENPQNSRRRIAIPVRYVNQVWDMPALLSNLARNLALHAATPFASLNARLERVVVRLHEWLGVEVSDPDTTYPRNGYRGVSFSLHEDSAGNPVHLFLVCLIPGLLLFSQSPHRALLWTYGAAVAASGLLFCIILKWQPWHSRLHLSLFILAAPLLATLLAERIRRRGLVFPSLLLLLLSVPWLFWSRPRPLAGPQSVFSVPRSSQSFANRPDLEPSYTQGIEVVRQRGCSSVGLVLGGNDWEYPFWALLHNTETPARLEHLEVHNFTRVLTTLTDANFHPCAVIAIGVFDEELLHKETRYQRAYADPRVSVYLADEPRP